MALFGHGEVYGWSLRADQKHKAPDERASPQFSRPARLPDLPVGLFCAPRVQPRFAKIFLFFRNQNQSYICRRLVPLEGRLAIVTDAGRDAVDADAPITNGVDADGEVVWS